MIAKPLSDLTRNDVKFTFGNEQRIAFEMLEKKICEKPVLMLFDKNTETELHTDASKFGIGAILMQKCSDDNQFHPVHYLSRKTSPDQENWISYELELFAIYTAVMKFRHYLLDIHFKLDIGTSTIQLRNNPQALSRMYIITSSLLHNLMKAQDQDERIKVIKEVIEVKPYKDYVMHNGLLCKFVNSQYQIAIPEEMELNIILKAHQEGHFKTQKLESVIKIEFYISNLRTKNEKFVSNCIECILLDRKAGKKEGKLHPINKEPIPKRPRQRIKTITTFLR